MMFQKEWLPLRVGDDGKVYGAQGTLIASRKMTEALREMFAEEARGPKIDLDTDDVRIAYATNGNLYVDGEIVATGGTPIPDPDPTGEYPDGWHPAGCDDCCEGEKEQPGPLVMAVGDLGHDQIGKTIRVKINEYMTMEAVLIQVSHTRYGDGDSKVSMTTITFEHEPNRVHQIKEMLTVVEVFDGQ